MSRIVNEISVMVYKTYILVLFLKNVKFFINIDFGVVIELKLIEGTKKIS